MDLKNTNSPESLQRPAKPTCTLGNGDQDIQCQTADMTNLRALTLSNTSIAPITRLPHEILTYIFEIDLYSMDRPKLLSRVTRHWRDIAISSPRLWALITIEARLPAETLALYLKRSAAAPLDLTIDGRTPPDATALLLVIPHVSRWRSLRTKYLGGVYLWKLMALLRPLSAPILRELDISYPDNLHIKQDLYSPVFEGGTPSLELLRLQGVSPLLLPASLPAAKRLNLVKIPESHYMNIKCLSTVLHSLSSLTHLVIHGNLVSPYRLEVLPSSPIELPSLCSLQMRGNNEDNKDISTLLSNILAPQLKTVSSFYFQESDFETLTELNPQNPPCFASVRSLSLIEGCFSQESITFLSHIFPTVTNLHCISLRCWGAQEVQPILKHLRGDFAASHASKPWPNLQTLSIVCSIGIEWDLLCTCVGARADGDRPLSKVCLDETLLLKTECIQLETQVEVESIELATLLADLEIDSGIAYPL